MRSFLSMLSGRLAAAALVCCVAAGCSASTVLTPQRVPAPGATAAGGGPSTGSTAAVNANGTPQLRHVFVLILENQAEDNTFGTLMPVPYLQNTVEPQGAFVPNYYGTSHYSLGNYTTLISGQSATTQNQSDCGTYNQIGNAQSVPPYGQIKGDGCVYPASVVTLPDQLTSASFTYRGYMEDMGNDLEREGSRCGQTQPTATNQTYGVPDLTQKAENGDQYAQRHNPFAYFQSLIGTSVYGGPCAANVVPLDDSTLTHDLASVATTPNFSFITPNLCNDGHDVPCKFPGAAGTTAGTYANENAFLQKWVPIITRSPAFRQDGLLMITFDESSPAKNAAVGSDTTTDASACCNETSETDPNTLTPGLPPGASTNVSGGGAGGGKTGTILLSPYIPANTITQTAYNHYNTLRSIEDEFGLGHLGFAAYPGTAAFGTDVYGTTQTYHTLTL